MRSLMGRRGRVAAGGLLVCALVLALGPWAGGTGSAAPSPSAHAAKRKSLNLRGTAYLHLVRRSGSTLYEQGTVTGSLPGTVTARFTTSIAKVTGTITFHPNAGGTLSMTAVGYPQSTRTVVPFNGNIAVSGGSGRFRNALGSGTFTGTANRRTWAITVNASARITY